MKREIIRGKLEILKNSLGCGLLLENGAIFTPVPDTEMSEPDFLNRLYLETGCGTLLGLSLSRTQYFIGAGKL